MLINNLKSKGYDNLVFTSGTGGLLKVGIPIGVPNAHLIVKEKCIFITDSNGGFGVLNELVEKILKSQSKYSETLAMMKNKTFK